MKQLRVFMMLLVLVSLLPVATAFGQNFEVPLTLSDGVNTNTLYLGVLSSADVCINAADGFNGHFEQFLPPAPPGGVFDVRFVAYKTGLASSCYDQGSPNDFRPFFNSAQKDTFRIRQQKTDVGGDLIMTWPNNLSQFFTAMAITQSNNDGVVVNMLTTFSYNLTQAGLEDGNLLRIVTTGPQPPPNPGPCFGLSAWPSGVSAQLGGFTDVTVTASNVGTTNPMNVTGVLSNNPAFSVISPPVPFVVPTSGSVPVVVRFTPAAAGLTSGNITFTHDATHPDCGGGNTQTVLAVNGTGVEQGGNLIFSAPTVNRCDNSNGYSESLLLESYAAGSSSGHLKALQLDLVMPTALLNNLGGISRGSAIPSPAWNFSYVVYEDNGTGEDTAKIVIFGNGTNALGPSASARELVRFNYGTANINGANQAAAIALRGVLGATRVGTDAGITPITPQVVNIVDQIYRGDVNDDDVLDILDLLLIVDHILNIAPLTGNAFLAADIAPWPTGDGVVNVLDLALLQDIILNGSYPPGLECGGQSPPAGPVIATSGNGLSKLTPGMDVKLTFYITTNGITVRMENIVAVNGLQLEFRSVPTVPPDLTITTFIPGEGVYSLTDDLLRVLIYDRAGSRIQPNDQLVANIPFSIANPRGIDLEHFVVAGRNNERLENVEIEIVNTAAPELPVEYALYQNYPNPFNPETRIKFAVPVAGDVKIVIYDLLGQEVRTLFASHVERGTREVTWDGLDNRGAKVSTGMYLYRMTAGSFVQARKMLLMK